MERRRTMEKAPLNSRNKAGDADPGPQNMKNMDHHPQSKVPHDLREKLARNLPLYSGTYGVGMMEIEVPVDEPRTFSHITRHKRHILELETVLFNIYYPSAFGSGNGKDPGGREKWSRATWMPRPRRKMAKGFSRFSGVPAAILVPYLLAAVGLTKTRAFRNAHLAYHWPAPHNVYAAGYDVKNQAGKPPEGEPESPIFPLLIFSHGLGGGRTTYSSVCGEFASYGFIVVAIEHRDGSGVRTFVNHPSEDWRRENAVDHLPEEHKEPYDKIDYLWPRDNPVDTAPHNEKGVDHELRKAQIQMRKAEIKEVEKVMEIIHAGDGELIYKKNLRKKGMIGSSSRGLNGVDWSRWKGRFHLKQVTMLGHSFGAATAVAVLRDRAMFPNMGQGIIYDVWGGPVIFDGDDKITCPLLGINSEAFMYWEQNFKTASRISMEAEESGALSWLMTVQGTIHLSQSDFQILFPHICRILLGATANPQRAIGLNVNASLEFLRLVMPDRISQMNRGSDEGILKVTTLSQMPTEHRPKDKWIGLRLASKAPADLTRGLTRGMRKRDAKSTDGSVGDEIWMHLAPTEEALRRHGLAGRAAPQEAEQKPTIADLSGGDVVQPPEQTSASPRNGGEDSEQQTEVKEHSVGSHGQTWDSWKVMSHEGPAHDGAHSMHPHDKIAHADPGHSGS